MAGAESWKGYEGSEAVTGGVRREEVLAREEVASVQNAERSVADKLFRNKETKIGEIDVAQSEADKVHEAFKANEAEAALGASAAEKAESLNSLKEQLKEILAKQEAVTSRLMDLNRDLIAAGDGIEEEYRFEADAHFKNNGIPEKIKANIVEVEKEQSELNGLFIDLSSKIDAVESEDRIAEAKKAAEQRIAASE